MITFTVHVIPVAKGRPRIGRVAGRPMAFTPAKTRQAEADFIALADPHAPPAPLQGPIDIRLVFVLPIPQSRPAWWKMAAAAGRVYPAKKPDLDNLVKLVLDSFNRSGRWWRDDAQVVEVQAGKSYGDTPQTQVRMYEISELRRGEPVTP